MGSYGGFAPNLSGIDSWSRRIGETKPREVESCEAELGILRELSVSVFRRENAVVEVNPCILIHKPHPQPEALNPKS